MKYTLLTLLGLVLAGCDEMKTTPPSSTSSQTGTAAVNRDNTGVNVRDRTDVAKTPIDQKENQPDIDVTAKIRQQVLDLKDLSQRIKKKS